MSTPESKVLEALREYPQRSSDKLMEITGLAAGEIYPTLYRLESTGKISSRWLDGPYPRRRIYWIERQPDHDRP